MISTTSTEQQTSAQQLAAEIKSMSTDVIQEVAEFLDGTPDENLFGDNEFVVRSKILKILAKAYTARMAQKKTATSAVPSPVRTASDLLNSKATEIESR
jgi:hypothetical protein